MAVNNITSTSEDIPMCMEQTKGLQAIVVQRHVECIGCVLGTTEKRAIATFVSKWGGRSQCKN